MQVIVFVSSLSISFRHGVVELNEPRLLILSKSSVVFFVNTFAVETSAAAVAQLATLLQSDGSMGLIENSFC